MSNYCLNWIHFIRVYKMSGTPHTYLYTECTYVHLRVKIVWEFWLRLMNVMNEITVTKIVYFSSPCPFKDCLFPLWSCTSYFWHHSSSVNTETTNCWAEIELQVSSLVFHMASVVLIIVVASRDAVSCGWQIVLLQPLHANKEETKFRHEEQAAFPLLWLT